MGHRLCICASETGEEEGGYIYIGPPPRDLTGILKATFWQDYYKDI